MILKIIIIKSNKFMIHNNLLEQKTFIPMWIYYLFLTNDKTSIIQNSLHDTPKTEHKEGLETY